jgi:dipeptidase E
MSRLFLTSQSNYVLDRLQTVANFNPTLQKVCFIPNASDPYKETYPDLQWLHTDFDQWKKLNYQTEWVDLITDSKKLIQEKYDIIHFAGGSPIYLILLLRKLKLIDHIKELVIQNQVVFSGSSAGAMIAGFDLNSERFADLESYPENADLIPQLNGDFSALHLVDFNILPHFNNPDFINQNQKVIASPEHNFKPLIFLRDNHAIWVENDSLRFIEV